MEPGGDGLRRETKGWSIHPPASAIRWGMEPMTEVISMGGA
jgi:hypothetical protein